VALRSRISVMAAAVVGVTLLFGSVVCFVAMRHELRSQVDEQLVAQGDLIGRARNVGVAGPLPALPVRMGGSAGYGQIVRGSADQLFTFPVGPGEAPIPLVQGDVPVVEGADHATMTDRDIDGVHTRVYTFTLGGGAAVQLGRPLTGVDSTLGWLRGILIALCVIGTALAALLTRVLSRRAIAPLTRVTEAAEHIESTGDLGRRVPAGDTRDEPGRLALRFNAMLDRLQGAQVAQRQLIADASHELRTPVTALRTNVELLAHGPLVNGDRAAVAQDALGQAEELSLLVGDVIELARGDAQPLSLESIALGELAAEAVDRGQRHAPDHLIRLTVDEPVVVSGDRARLARALNNLIDNAVKYAPEGTAVEVTVGHGAFSVRDRGPGIAIDELPHVFDRFYRGDGVRGRDGSGLGLAIVKQIADMHGACVSLGPAEGVGTVATFAFSDGATSACDEEQPHREEGSVAVPGRETGNTEVKAT
jgi:two-component system sensor histidine kinase MprB